MTVFLKNFGVVLPAVNKAVLDQRSIGWREDGGGYVVELEIGRESDLRGLAQDLFHRLETVPGAMRRTFPLFRELTELAEGDA